jgi:hypothetical protein
MDRRTFLAAFGGSLAAALMQLEHAAVAGRSEGQRRSALRLLGHAHQEAGESAFDRLDLGAAADHLRQAHEIGAELGDADMIANALIELGDLARWRRRSAMPQPPARSRSCGAASPWREPTPSWAPGPPSSEPSATPSGWPRPWRRSTTATAITAPGVCAWSGARASRSSAVRRPRWPSTSRSLRPRSAASASSAASGTCPG